MTETGELLIGVTPILPKMDIIKTTKIGPLMLTKSTFTLITLIIKKTPAFSTWKKTLARDF